MNKPMIKLDAYSSPPAQAGEVKYVVQSKALVLRLPFARLVWNRPVSVFISQPGADERRLPIVDATRLAQVALLAGVLSVGLVVAATRK